MAISERHYSRRSRPEFLEACSTPESWRSEIAIHLEAADGGEQPRTEWFSRVYFVENPSRWAFLEFVGRDSPLKVARD